MTRLGAYIQTMMNTKRLIAALALCLVAGTASAQEEGNEFQDGLNRLQEGSRIILENLMDEMRPMIDEVRPFYEEEMLPFLRSLGDVIDDLTNYALPERLPNGDIIIRRLPDAPPLEDVTEPLEGTEGEIEL